MSQQDDDSNLMSAGEAQRYLGVSKVRMSSFLKDGTLSVFQKSRDTRIKWVSRSEVEALKRELDQAKKLTARAA